MVASGKLEKMVFAGSVVQSILCVPPIFNGVVAPVVLNHPYLTLFLGFSMLITFIEPMLFRTFHSQSFGHRSGLCICNGKEIIAAIFSLLKEHFFEGREDSLVNGNEPLYLSVTIAFGMTGVSFWMSGDNNFKYLSLLTMLLLFISHYSMLPKCPREENYGSRPYSRPFYRPPQRRKLNWRFPCLNPHCFPNGIDNADDDDNASI